LIQSDESIIGMENGCICCTLQSDLVKQIIGLVDKKMFNYILIEASGVSAPHEIAPLFDLDHEHEEGDEEDPDHEHETQLGEVARLDTCVTMIDQADFYNNLGSIRTFEECDMVGTIAELMMDQIEFANVIVLNKGDLVDQKKQSDIYEKISLINPKAKILKSIVHSNIDVKEILHTNVYKEKEDFYITSMQNETNIEARAGRDVPDACTARFDIKSFVYRARKPFHPERFDELVMEPYFMTDPCLKLPDEEEDAEGNIRTREQRSEEELKIYDEAVREYELEMEKAQEEALVKQETRIGFMGELLRSKGFFWMASHNDVIGGWQQAGNILRVIAESRWMCLEQEIWKGTDAEPLVMRDMTEDGTEDGKVYEYEDRRQEIVFIGHRINQDAIVRLLDQCLLTDEEFALGPERWKETMKECDKFNFELEEEEEWEDEEDIEEED